MSSSPTTWTSRLVFFSLFVWASLPVFTQIPDLTHQPIDSALVQLDDIMHIDSLKDVFHQAGLTLLARAKKEQNEATLARAHQFVSTWHNYYNLFDSDSIFYHEGKALEIWENLGELKEQAEAHRNLCTAYLNNSGFEEAQGHIFKALEIYEELNDQVGVGRVYKNIASLYRVMEENEESVKYGRMAIEILKDTDEYDTYCITLMNMIPAYTELKLYDSALYVANHCIETYQAQDLKQIGIVIRALSYRGDVYKFQQQYELAEADYIQTYDMVLEAVGTERAKSWRMDIGQLQVLKKEYAEALPNLLVAIEDYTADEIPEAWLVYSDIALCYKELGDYQNALLYTEMWKDSREEMYLAKVEGLESEGMIKYETGKKEEAIAQRDQQIQQEQQIQRLGFGLASLFALLLAGMAYFFVRNRKVNRQLSSLNERLSVSNADKELLLKEIHHRVKNNLQTISSLLYLQSAHIEDQSVKAAVAEGQHRVESMALIHQKLYQRENLAAIEMKDYLSNLGESLFTSFGMQQGPVRLAVEMNELELDVDTAVPIGLIVNELITNSLKYAFPDKQAGTITLQLNLISPEELQLIVADNGIGKAENQTAQGTAFGSQLVQMLTTQLGGKMDVQPAPGYQSTFSFTRFQAVKS